MDKNLSFFQLNRLPKAAEVCSSTFLYIQHVNRRQKIEYIAAFYNGNIDWIFSYPCNPFPAWKASIAMKLGFHQNALPSLCDLEPRLAFASAANGAPSMTEVSEPSLPSRSQILFQESLARGSKVCRKCRVAPEHPNMEGRDECTCRAYATRLALCKTLGGVFFYMIEDPIHLMFRE